MYFDKIIQVSEAQSCEINIHGAMLIFPSWGLEDPSSEVGFKVEVYTLYILVLYYSNEL